jgi:hypothetical protein
MRFEKSDAVGDEGVAAVNMLISRHRAWLDPPATDRPSRRNYRKRNRDIQNLFGA